MLILRLGSLWRRRASSAGRAGEGGDVGGECWKGPRAPLRFRVQGLGV